MSEKSEGFGTLGSLKYNLLVKTDIRYLLNSQHFRATCILKFWQSNWQQQIGGFVDHTASDDTCNACRLTESLFNYDIKVTKQCWK